MLKISPGKMIMLPGRPSGPLYDGPLFPVGSSKLGPQSHIPVRVGRILNILVGEPVFRREKPVRASVIPAYGALNLFLGGHREAIHEEPVGEGLSKLKPFVRVLEIPLMGGKGRGRVCLLYTSPSPRD